MIALFALMVISLSLSACVVETQLPEIFTLHYAAEPGGELLGEADQRIEAGKDALTVTAQANEGYVFVKWSDGVETAARTDGNVQADITVTAEFARAVYTVNYLTDGNGYISGESEQKIGHGENGAHVTAVPDEGYIFTQWSDGLTDDIRMDKNITSDKTVTAEFKFLYAGGDGTIFNPFIIETYEQLCDMRYYPSCYYKLANDLDLSGINHEPIFDDNNWFSGEFNGNGRTIKNMTVATESNFPSLFGFIMDGSVGNLNIENASISTFNFNTVEAGTNYYVGIVAGMVAGFVHDINVSGKIIADGFDYDYVAIGGLAGNVYGTVADCTVDIRIEVSNAKSQSFNNNPFVFGGMIGVGTSAYVRSCTASGSIEIVNSCDYVQVGGLIGYHFTNANTDTYIKDCETNVEITGDKNYKAGGVLGYIKVAADSVLTISNCAAHGDITIGYAGGFVYECYSDGTLTIESCFTDNDITGYLRGVGFAYYLKSNNSSFNVSNCYTTGNITAIYYDGGSGGYASGFCGQANSTNFVGCFTKGSVKAMNSAGFIIFLYDSIIEQCYSQGNVLGGLRGAGFCLFVNDSKLSCCYSLSHVIITNTDEANTGRTFVGGFVFSLINSTILNIYYAGSVTGYAYSAGSFGQGNIIGAFIGLKNNSDIINCHTLHVIQDYAPDVISDNRDGFEKNIDLQIYYNAENMYFLSDKLNEGLDEAVWVNTENNCPRLKFYD